MRLLNDLKWISDKPLPKLQGLVSKNCCHTSSGPFGCRSSTERKWSLSFSRQANEDKRQADLLLKAWEESGKVYGYRKLHEDLLDQGEMCCPNRVARLTCIAGIKALIGDKRSPGICGGRPSVVVDNALDRQFDVEAPDTAWVTDITYIRTCEGFAYLAVVIDLYSRRVISWAMQSRQTTDVVLQAVLTAVLRRKPKAKVLIHSDQGSQFTSMDWASFLRKPDLVHSMSRRGNCHDNAVAESFFNLLKRSTASGRSRQVIPTASAWPAPWATAKEPSPISCLSARALSDVGTPT